jgi:hypothetical protein
MPPDCHKRGAKHKRTCPSTIKRKEKRGTKAGEMEILLCNPLFFKIFLNNSKA